MGTSGARSVVLDAGALIAFERGDERVRTLVAKAVRAEGMLVLPAGVVGQVWRNGARQARLAALIGSSVVTVEALDEARAKACGVLCGLAGTADVVDASVILTARLHGAPVVTSDPDDLRRLDREVEVFAV